MPLDLDFDPTNGGSVPELKNPPGTGFIPYYQLCEKHGVASLLGIYLSSSMFDLIWLLEQHEFTYAWIYQDAGYVVQE